MNKVIKFKSICADYRDINNHIFYMDDDYSDSDCEDTCLIWNHITFYGIPFNLSDDQIDCIYEGDYSNAIKIGKLSGCMILCKQILNEGYDPLQICDDIDGDLEYTISALSDEGGPLNMETGDPDQDAYYIHEFTMEQSYNDLALKSKIIAELPKLIFIFLHVNPDLLAFYPVPMEYTLDQDKNTRYKTLQYIAAQKIDDIKEIGLEESKKQNDEKILNFGKAYQLSEDELNVVMGRRHAGSSYPEEAKNHEEYDFYESNGFEEVGNSRLLYKYIKHVY